METNQKQRLYSTRRQVRMLSILPISVLSVLLVLACVYFGWLLFDNCVYDYNRELVYSVDDLDELLSELDVYFSYIVSWDDDFYVLAFPQKGAGLAKASSQNIWQKLRAEVGIDPLINQLFYYGKEDVGYHCLYGDAQDQRIQNKVMLNNMLKDHCDEGVDLDWFVLECEGQLYLTRIYGKGAVYIGGTVNLTSFLNRLISGGNSAGYQSGYGNTAMSGKEVAQRHMLELSSRYLGSSVFLSAEVVRVQCTLLHGSEVHIWMDIPISSILGYVPFVALLCIVVSLIILALVPALMQKCSQQVIIQPFDRLYGKINRIRSRDFSESEPEQYESYEFRKIDQAFDAMINEITQLRIAEYENTLLRQKTQINYYNLQLRPHFFINCLKNVYGLIEQGKTEEVQQFIRELSGYVRYLYKDAFEPSCLRDELQYCSYYIRIVRQIRHAAIECVIDVDEDMLICRIPPFLILTLIENALKHGLSSDASQKINLQITGRVIRSDNAKSIELRVENDGYPIPEQHIAALNAADSDQFYKEGHIGIWNVRQQMLLMYGASAQMRIQNIENRVCCCISLPLM